MQQLPASLACSFKQRQEQTGLGYCCTNSLMLHTPTSLSLVHLNKVEFTESVIQDTQVDQGNLGHVC